MNDDVLLFWVINIFLGVVMFFLAFWVYRLINRGDE